MSEKDPEQEKIVWSELRFYRFAYLCIVLIMLVSILVQPIEYNVSVDINNQDVLNFYDYLGYDSTFINTMEGETYININGKMPLIMILFMF